ncbi:YbdD/YjiX family protein [uncultured Corynebacterium sp.]|mgnify:FL=1|uniref:YbdD/YjiX family protein n=1 Tax=uncultured Corynebacterium sp. TaxID=159447 RepID=UPI0025F38CE1|nr:YbdD/YjiX family protein [uncultured Corynebacterium sp.]
MGAIARGAVSTFRWMDWYIKELMGDNDYAKYCAHQRTHHPEAELMTEREFWKARWARQEANPGSRCC